MGRTGVARASIVIILWRAEEGRQGGEGGREDSACLQGAEEGQVMEEVCVYGWVEGVQLSQKTNSISSENC